ncbi:MAG: hydroxymethylglutaryl-CoA synthase family protein [Spirochaetales bacterium]|nr:hydroxymethylglutaryl-CoA synthase family protein [Spirochaetales bacterium]
MKHHIGIESLNLYGGSLYLDQEKLARARGLDPEKVVRDFLIDTRTVIPPFEDTVTMGANAALPVVKSVDRESIGMLIVGTESSVDFGKPISTNIMGALGLGPHLRNYETKHACYSGVAALDTAVNWIASGLNRGRKALVISTDFSRMHLNTKEEFVLGGVAAAALVSEQPRIVEYEIEKRGTWSSDVYDTFRPSAREEMGNNEVSLFTYMDAIEGAYLHYRRMSGEEGSPEELFSYLAYHTPFPGMAFQAHRTLLNLDGRRPKDEVMKSFDAKVVPGLKYARRVGSTYGASNFVGLAGIAGSVGKTNGRARIGFFSYGSGAIGEFYSGVLCDGAAEAIASMAIDRTLDERTEVSVDEYETIERTRESYIENPDFEPDLSLPAGLYSRFYGGKRRLILKNVKNFYRTYEWS